MTKNISRFIIFIFCFSAFGQNSDANEKGENSSFSLSISFFNHAGQTSNGTTNYKLNDSTLTISRNYLLSDAETTLYSKRINSNLISKIKKLNLENLQDNYFNKCIVITSGNEYFISISINKIPKNIHLHHYYEKQIEKLINAINREVPKTLKIEYLSKNTKQDCK